MSLPPPAFPRPPPVPAAAPWPTPSPFTNASAAAFNPGPAKPALTPAMASAAPTPAAKLPSPDPEKTTTNVDQLMDAVGIAGVDIGAEEEGLRAANERGAASLPLPPGMDRSRKQDFIDPQVLAEAVKKIAAAFQLRTLEPDTIPLIALAVRHRLSSLIADSVAARDHRLAATHLRPPPLVPSRRKRKHSSPDSSSLSDPEDDPDLDREPAWDTVVFSEPEKLLGTLERVDREEERRRRRERMLRDQKEEEDRLLLAAHQAAELAAALDGPGHDDPSGGTPAGVGGGGPDDKPPAKKKKKKKELNAAQQAKNMSEDLKKRFSDQVAMRSLGGASYAWLNAGGGASTSASFTKPAPSSFTTPTSLSLANAAATTTTTNAFGQPGALKDDPPSRLSNVPPRHDANRQRQERDEWAAGLHVVEMEDLVWALERERGAGVGRGTGALVAVKARAGVIGGKLRRP